jgi:hypothetical protein
MEFLMLAAVMIIIAVVLRWWMNVNFEEGMLGKGYLLIVIILVIVGLLAVFGLLPSGFRFRP